jgi:bacterioferritin
VVSRGRGGVSLDARIDDVDGDSAARDRSAGATCRTAGFRGGDHLAFESGRQRWPTTAERIGPQRESTPMSSATDKKTARGQLIADLNSDLAREYQAIIAYVVYSQVLKGAEYMAIAGELEIHAGQELQHALTIAKQIDYLGGAPTVTPIAVKQSDDPKTMLRADLENENDTIRNYRQRVGQCEALGEYAIAEDIREILRQEQEHQIDLATALGIDVPDVSEPVGRKS